MNVEIRAEAALSPEKEYINGIAVAVSPDSTFKMHAPVALQQVGHVDALWPGAGGQDVADGGAAPQVQHAPTQRKYII